MKILVITGMSGAGKSVALKALEDNGFEAVDNIPPSLLPALLKDRSPVSPALAVSMDVRSRFFSAEQCLGAIEQARKGDDLQLVFLECEDEALRRRFSETRRRHPLAEDRPVMDGITLERQLLKPLKEAANKVIDTTDMQAADLKRELQREYSSQHTGALSLFIISFSYKQGLPREADLVFDTRFLNNPHYMGALKELTGKDKAVADYIQEDPGFADFFKHLVDLLLPLLPRYVEEGKSYLTIAIGCTGGRHRSVFTSEKLAGFLRKRGYNVDVQHRELK